MEDLEGIIGKDEKKWNEVKRVMSKRTPMELGAYYSNMINADIKHLGFTFSRYKFVSKMLMYKSKANVLELGCQEGLGALLLKQNMDLNRYVGIDMDEDAIKWNRGGILPDGLEFICCNFFCCEETCKGNFDAVVSLDVIEHIQKELEDEFCKVIKKSLKRDGIALIGTPNIMLAPYACEESRIGHVNLYDQKRLYRLMNKYFYNVLIFNMNDEVVNTGFAPMSCYIFALCCNGKE